MTLLDTTPKLDDAAAKALRLPVGVTSPLWFMIGSAAMVGAAMFWATRWMKPLETATATLEAEPKVLPRPEPEVQAAVEKAVDVAAELVTAPVETVAEVAEAVKETVVDPVVEAPVVVAAEPAAPVTPDDLTVLSGIGPKMAANLAERGVTTFAQIAAWTTDEIAALDKDMKLLGRIGRDAWVSQAQARL